MIPFQRRSTGIRIEGGAWHFRIHNQLRDDAYYVRSAAKPNIETKPGDMTLMCVPILRSKLLWPVFCNIRQTQRYKVKHTHTHASCIRNFVACRVLAPFWVTHPHAVVNRVQSSLYLRGHPRVKHLNSSHTELHLALTPKPHYRRHAGTHLSMHRSGVVSHLRYDVAIIIRK